MRETVERGYDDCASRYDAWRADTVDPQLASFIDDLPAGAFVLDIGCGSGRPVTKALAARGPVTGVDVSARQLELARVTVPTATLLHADILDCVFRSASFHAAVAVYSLFHLPRERHGELVSKLASWIAPGGRLWMTVAASEDPGSTEEDFFGTRMSWSAHAPDVYAELLGRNGFRIEARGVIGHGFAPERRAPDEEHPYFAARRTGPRSAALIRPGKPGDAEAVAEIGIANWRAAYRGIVPDDFLARMELAKRAARVRERMARGIEEVRVACDDAGRVVAFASIGAARDDDVDPATTGEIGGLYVLPEFWRGGLGRTLLADSEAVFRDRGFALSVLWVFEANDAARRFYAANGYEPDGARCTLSVGKETPAVRYRKSLEG